MLQTIAKPFGWLLLKLYELTGNYGIALILFALGVRLIMLPFSVKSKMSMLKTTPLQAQMKELEKKHGANSQKYADEVRKLYKEAGASPMSGCLWSFIPIPIMLALYQAIRFPLTVMMGISSDLLAEGGAIAAKLSQMNFSSTLSNVYLQVAQTEFISKNFEAFRGITDKLVKIDFSFIGLNLSSQPNYKFWTFFKAEHMWPLIGLFALPFLAGLATMIQTKATEMTNGATTERAQEATASMMAFMPVITIVFGFSMPAALMLYWAAGSIFSAIQDLALAKIYKRAYERENAEAIARQKAREEELEAKRLETERLREQNATVQNRNTSKKKRQMQDRLEREARQAEWESGNSGSEKNPSRVGDRPNARGRAYDPDRYSNKADE